jgi:hypothetical protein
MSNVLRSQAGGIPRKVTISRYNRFRRHCLRQRPGKLENAARPCRSVKMD